MCNFHFRKSSKLFGRLVASTQSATFYTQPNIIWSSLYAIACNVHSCGYSEANAVVLSAYAPRVLHYSASFYRECASWTLTCANICDPCQYHIYWRSGAFDVIPSCNKDELNALRYASGYVPRKFLKKYEKKGEKERKKTGKKIKQFKMRLGNMAVANEKTEFIVFKWMVSKGRHFNSEAWIKIPSGQISNVDPFCVPM